MWAKLWTKWCHEVSEQSFAKFNTHVKLQKGIDPKLSQVPIIEGYEHGLKKQSLIANETR
jgi:hypothetical protein